MGNAQAGLQSHSEDGGRPWDWRRRVRARNEHRLKEAFQRVEDDNDGKDQTVLELNAGDGNSWLML